MSFGVLDSSTGLALLQSQVSVSVAQAGPPTPNVIIDSASGPFHALTIQLDFKSLHHSTTIRLLVTGQSLDPAVSFTGLSTDTLMMMRMVGEEEQIPYTHWDDQRFIFMRVTSGDITVDAAPRISSGNRAKGKGTGKPAGENVISATKGQLCRHSYAGVVSHALTQIYMYSPVQTALRRVYLPGSTGQAKLSIPSFDIIERPNLNNSTGQRLWDCSLGLSLYLAADPSRLVPSPTLTDAGAGRESKRLRLDAPSTTSATDCSSLQVVELGAGCGLLSLLAHALLETAPHNASLDSPSCFEVIATDVEATVESTLAENLLCNSGHQTSGEGSKPEGHWQKRIRIRSEVLEWGAAIPDDMRQMRLKILGSTPVTVRNDLLVLASDVLYNPSFHQPLLDTLLALLRPPDIPTGLQCPRREAKIAYKHRTEGDDDFFRMAREAGLAAEKVWEWGKIQVWSLR